MTSFLKVVSFLSLSDFSKSVSKPSWYAPHYISATSWRMLLSYFYQHVDNPVKPTKMCVSKAFLLPLSQSLQTVLGTRRKQPDMYRRSTGKVNNWPSPIIYNHHRLSLTYNILHKSLCSSFQGRRWYDSHDCRVSMCSLKRSAIAWLAVLPLCVV